MQVTPELILKTAQRYLWPGNRTVIELQLKPKNGCSSGDLQHGFLSIAKAQDARGAGVQTPRLMIELIINESFLADHLY